MNKHSSFRPSGMITFGSSMKILLIITPTFDEVVLSDHAVILVAQ